MSATPLWIGAVDISLRCYLSDGKLCVDVTNGGGFPVLVAKGEKLEVELDEHGLIRISVHRRISLTLEEK